MNEVHQNTLKKRNELDNVLKLLIKGLTKKQIREKLNISKTNLSNYLSKLEDSNNIKREGKYIIKVLSSSLIHPRVTRNHITSKLNKRGHAHNFKILFPQETEDLRNKPLIKNLIAIKRIETLNFGSLRFSYKRFTIWINKSTLTVYSNNSYYSDDALISKFTALKDLDNLIKNLKDKFGLKGIYGIEIFREHYGLIFNQFARWLLDKNSKMEIKDKGNKSILWVDDSKDDDIGLKEFESPDPLIINNADILFESHLRTNWKVTPEFILNNFAISQNQLTQFSQQIKSHLALIKEYRSENKAWRKEESKKIKDEVINGVQRTLF